MYCTHTSMWNFGFWDEQACSLAECYILFTSRTFECKQGDNVIYEKLSAVIVRISVGDCICTTAFTYISYGISDLHRYLSSELHFLSFPSNVKFTRGIYSVLLLTQHKLPTSSLIVLFRVKLDNFIRFYSSCNPCRNLDRP